MLGLVPEALAQMRQMRPLFLKCDEAFFTGMDAPSLKRTLLEMLLELAQGLDSLLIVSGIETEARAAELRAMGIGALQGYALGVPCAVHAA